MKLGDGVGRELSPDAATYTYAGIGYANPDAVTQIANGFSTSTYTYDANGNLAQKTTENDGRLPPAFRNTAREIEAATVDTVPTACGR